jgi:hypothetical protein
MVIDNQAECVAAYPFQPVTWTESNVMGIGWGGNCARKYLTEISWTRPTTDQMKVRDFLNLSKTEQLAILNLDVGNRSVCDYYTRSYNKLICKLESNPTTNQTTTPGIR